MANEQAKAFIDQATQSLQNSQFDKALELIEQAIAIEPGASDSFVLKGICLSQLNQPDAATDAFKQAMLLSPYNPKAYYNLAVHQNALGNKKEALEFAREAVGVDPRHTGARQLVSSLEQEIVGAKEDFVKERIDVGPKPTVAPPSPGTGTAPPPGTGDSQLRPPKTPPPSSSSKPGPVPPPNKNAPEKPYTAPANANPYAGVNPTSQYSNQGFNRPGYVPQSGAIPWVENMGNAWTAIGWIVAIGWIPLVIIGYGVSQNIQAHRPQTLNDLLSTGTMAVDVVFLLLASAGVIWMILDTMNRRKSGWWVAGTVIGCCCATNILLIPIYLLVGRRVD